VDQLNDYADRRLYGGCVYCGGPDDTVDHVPSRVFLDKPFPENLPVVPACRSCNNGFSRDEEYVAAVIECVVAGSTEPRNIRRPRIAKALERSPALSALIEQGREERYGITTFSVDTLRIENVLLKLARGHAVFELSTPVSRDPRHFTCKPLASMCPDELDAFDAADVDDFYGEVGSRGMQRLQVVKMDLKSPDGRPQSFGLIVNDWVEVQEGRYRYLATPLRSGIRIKIVISEYLACEAIWED